MSRVRPGRVFDPAVVARNAEEKHELAVNLVFELLLRKGTNPVEELFDLEAEVQVEVLFMEDRGRGVGDGLDADDVEGAAAGLEWPGAVLAEESRRVGSVHFWQR
jgi:hypothetical protein